jgi:plastocyanin
MRFARFSSQVVMIAAVAFALTPGLAAAHTAGGQSYVFVGHQYTQANPMAAVSTEAAQDLASKSYVVGTPVDFQVDKNAFGTQAEFRWVWSQGSAEHQDGDTASHTYTKPGTYLVVLQARFSGSDYSDTDVISVNIVPRVDYVLPRATVAVSSTTVSGGFKVQFTAAARHDAAAQIASYIWEFGDGTTGEGKAVEHLYKSRDVVAFPYLRVKYTNGLVGEATFDLRGKGTQVTATNFPNLPGVVSSTPRRSGLAVSVPVMIAAAGLVVVGIFLVLNFWRIKQRT